jgi:chromosome partitioning protein
MIITVASYKGGCGKTMSAIHLAAYFQTKGSTLLIDGDLNRSATEWAEFGKLSFKVVDERQAAKFAPNFKYIIIDTQARPELQDLRALVNGCDLLIVPSSPDALSLRALHLTLQTLNQLEAKNYRVLITMAPPFPSHDGAEAIAMLQKNKMPVFENMIFRRAAFQKAALMGVIVDQVNDRRAEQGWQDYIKVAKEIV